jgi:NADPH-dependent 2,4-dienoyl-CoA reductase/sulfur reductase-like enzyme
MAAASVAAGAGLQTLVLDENPGPGGQVWRAITTTPVLRRPILGPDYWKGQEVVRAFSLSGAHHLPGATVWSLDPERLIGVSSCGAARLIRARRVVIATGALERPFPVPGWTLPGVMTVGAAQTLLKASGLLPTGRVVLVGSGPLLWLYANQLLKAGGKVFAILDTSDRAAWRTALRHVAGFARSPYLVKGLKLMAAVRRKVRVISGVTELAIEGAGRAETLIYWQGSRYGTRLPVDAVLLHQGVVPDTNLAMVAGIEHRWDDRQLCWHPLVDNFGGTSIEGVAIAGDGAGIAGWEAAVDRGRLAGIAAAKALRPDAPGLPDSAPIRRRLEANERARAFLDVLYRPAKAFRVPRGGTIVCRCEEVTARQVFETIAIGCEGPNQMKSFLRCGMGPCQGRLCGLTVTELIAEARGVSPAEVGHYRLRPPVKPLRLAELARLPRSEAAVKAVERE